MRKKLSSTLVHERIDEMLLRAQNVVGNNLPLANRYVTLARKLALKNRIRLRTRQKRQFCSHCYKIVAPGVSRTRITGKTISVYCSSCKKYSRYGYKEEK